LLLLALPLVFGLLSGTVMLLVSNSFWLPMQLGLFAMAALILPCLLLGNIFPFILSSGLVALIAINSSQQLLLLFNSPIFFILLSLLNLLLLSGFAWQWLKPGCRLPLNTKTNYQHANLWQFLQRFTRKPTTLHGSLLLGQGDSWRARSLRTLAFCWYLPGFMWLCAQLFGFTGLTGPSIILALCVMFPTFMLVEQLSNMLKRVRCAWLVLPASRQHVFQLLERQAFKEILLATLIISPLFFLLFSGLTVATMLILWPGILLCGTYLSWWLTNYSLFWMGLVMAIFNITVVAFLAFFWQQPLPAFLLTCLVATICFWLRMHLKQQLLVQNWAKLKVLKAQHLRAGLQ